MNNKPIQKIIVSTLLACFVFVFIAGSLFTPRAVYAIPVAETGVGFWGAKEVRLSAGQAIWASAIVGVVNSATLFAQQVAYDLAVGLATGCSGQNPCAFIDDPGTYFTRVSYDAMGEFIGNLAGPWEELGINLCSPRIPDIGLAIGLGLVQMYDRPTPKCDFLNTINNWRSVYREASDPHALLKHVSIAFKPGMSDLSQAYHAREEFRIRVAEKQRAVEQERDEGDGIKPKIDLISKQTRTPSKVMARNFENLADKGKGSGEPPTSMQVLKAVGGGDVWLAAGQVVLQTFTNTLVSRLLQSMLEGLFGPSGSNPLPNLSSQFGEFLDTNQAPSTGLSPATVSLLTPQIRGSGGEMEYLSELASCPNGNTSQYNCTIDSDFRNAIQHSMTGNPITVKQAIEKHKYLHRDWAFAYENPGQNSEPDYKSGYPYSSMKKLRLLRILPVGWEFAGDVIRNDGVPATLGDVIDGWDKTGDDAVCGTIDDESRFCGLVDPNWLLKAPIAQCAAKVYGATLDSSGSNRQEVCADLEHCVATDDSGACLSWGYCTREKNEWKFEGDSCLDQYASCDTFVSSSDEQFSLLENTVDFGVCTAQNAGCANYLTVKDSTGEWNETSVRNRIYLDSNKVQCDESFAGCTQFYRAKNVTMVPATTDEPARYDHNEGVPEEVYYRAVPGYFACGGEESDTGECNFTGNNKQGYAPTCRAEEVGCELYTPQNSDPGIPGIISALDKCPEKCEGYDTYIKQSSTFEPNFDNENLYSFIPSSAKSCSKQNEGCTEFTNLQTEQREYFTSLRACQQPADDSKTYFTWEGSDTDGYQLKAWNFKKSNATVTSSTRGTCIVADPAEDGEDADVVGTCENWEERRLCSEDSDCVSEELVGGSGGKAPCTNYEILNTTQGIQVDCIDGESNQAMCTKADVETDDDCRGFYDSDGNIYYRQLSRTVLSTNDCRGYRWTGFPALPLVDDATRADLEEEACDHGHGSWNDVTNQCVYLGAVSESNSCSQSSAECRVYKGNTSSNFVNLFTDDFETRTLEDMGWERIGSSGANVPIISSESLVVGGHSIKAKEVSANGGIRRSIVVDQDSKDDTYFVRFNIKGTADSRVEVSIDNDSFGIVDVRPEWEHIELGPLVINRIGQRLLFRSRTSDNITFFLDDVTLRRTPDSVYVIKNSWNTPSSCNRLPAEMGGGIYPGAMLGCRAYDTRDGREEYLRSFTTLCRERSVGCTELVQTFNTDSLESEQFNTTNNGTCRADPRVDTDTRPEDGAGDCYISIPGASTSLKVCNVGLGKTICEYGPGTDWCVDGERERNCSYLTSENIIGDDVTVPADISRYIVAEPEFACNADKNGCQALGQEGSANNVYLQNNPSRYTTDLCKYEALDCQSWLRTSDNSTMYFKAPEEKQCTWQSNFAIGRNSYSGWFLDEKQPVAMVDRSAITEVQCSGYGTWQSATKLCVDKEGNGLDLSFVTGLNGGTVIPGCGPIGDDDECGTPGTPGNPDNKPCKTCARICNTGMGGTWKEISEDEGVCTVNTPCHGKVEGTIESESRIPGFIVDVTQSYLIGGTTFGIWRNADALYAGRAGSCPEEEATCTAFIDPTDTSRENLQGTAYYRKDNERIEIARKACNGNISQQEGCVLFDNTDNPAEIWNAEESYTVSDNNNGKFVPPESITGDNNTNDFFKVARDRKCAEWFQCASAQLQRENGVLKSVCLGIGRCNATASNPEEVGSINTCGNWLSRPLLNDPPQISQDACNARVGFTWDTDRQRCNMAEGWRCAGWLGGLGGIWNSGPGSCELGRMTLGSYLLRDTTYSGQEYTGYSIPGIYRIDLLREAGVMGFETPRLVRFVPGESCTNNEGCNSGVAGSDFKCTINGQCVESPVGGCGDGACWGNTRTDNNICRGFPERSSPLPNTVEGIPEFENASKCETGNRSRNTAEFVNDNCECNYKKAEYGSEARYYPFDSEIAPGICVGADGNSKASCEQEGNDGRWEALTKDSNAIGWSGYCLDFDTSQTINANNDRNPCLAWYPVDQLPSALDINNQNEGAAWRPGQNGEFGKYYCLVADNLSDRVIFSDEVNVTSGMDGKIHIVTRRVGDEPIYQYDIEDIDIRIDTIPTDDGWGDRSPNNEIGPRHGLYTISPFHILQEQPVNNGRVMNYEAYNTSSDDEWWWWGGDDNGNCNDSAFCRNYIRNTQGVPSLTQLADALKRTDTGVGGVALETSDYNIGCEAFLNMNIEEGESDDEEYDGMAVLLRFDESQELTHIRIGYCAANGRAPGLLTTISNVHVKINLHPHCQYIAKIDDSLGARDSAPNTQMLWSGCTGAFCQIRHDGREMNSDIYERNLAGAPYGSAITTQNPLNANHPWYINHNVVIPEGDVTHEFAGWPYACRGLSDTDECTVGFNVGGLTGGGSSITYNGLNTIDTLPEAVTNFNNLFARAQEGSVLKWDGDHYIESRSNHAVWDARNDPATRGSAPEFNAVIGSGPLSINNQSGIGERVIGTDGFMFANAKYFVWADDRKMPIRTMKIDWGDGQLTQGNALYKNAKSSCPGNTFGTSSEACTQEPYEFAHLYSCGGDSDPGWVGAECPVFDFRQLYGGCCMFKPKVQAIDNWGFCNGSCSPEGYCIDSQCNNDDGAWSEFQGDIILAP